MAIRTACPWSRAVREAIGKVLSRKTDLELLMFNVGLRLANLCHYFSYFNNLSANPDCRSTFLAIACRIVFASPQRVTLSLARVMAV